MLKVNPEPLFSADVSITVPGQKEPGLLSFTFKYKNREDLGKFWKEIEHAEDFELILAIAEDWSGIDVDFNEESVKTFLKNYPAAGREIAREYQHLLLESRLKN